MNKFSSLRPITWKVEAQMSLFANREVGNLTTAHSRLSICIILFLILSFSSQNCFYYFVWQYLARCKASCSWFSQFIELRKIILSTTNLLNYNNFEKKTVKNCLLFCLATCNASYCWFSQSIELRSIILLTTKLRQPLLCDFVAFAAQLFQKLW